jgi:3-isopropylmalate/(R)-2-methylmalate dehydratase large subunit
MSAPSAPENPSCPAPVRLTPGRRVLFLTKDPELIRKQIHDGLDLRMEDLRVEDLLDDINTPTR